MAIPTNSDGHIPRWARYVPCLRRQIDWLAHIISFATTCHLSQLFQMYGIQHRWWPTIHLYCIPGIPSDMGRKAQTILGRNPQSNGRAELAVKTAKRIVNGNTDTLWTMTRSCSQGHHRHNYYSTAGSGIPSHRNHSFTNHILNG